MYNPYRAIGKQDNNGNVKRSRPVRGGDVQHDTVYSGGCDLKDNWRGRNNNKPLVVRRHG